MPSHGLRRTPLTEPVTFSKTVPVVDVASGFGFEIVGIGPRSIVTAPAAIVEATVAAAAKAASLLMKDIRILPFYITDRNETYGA